LVGNAQERLGEAHQDDALLGGEGILVHEGVNATVRVTVGPRRPHQPSRQLGDARALLGGGGSSNAQFGDELGLIRQERGRDLLPGRRRALPLPLASALLPGLAHVSTSTRMLWTGNPS